MPSLNQEEVLAQVRQVCRQRRRFYTEDAITRAGMLLRDLYLVGIDYGVRPKDWDYVAGLPGAVVDVLDPWKADIPQTPDGAVEQLDQVVAAVKQLLPADRAARVERDVLRVRVPRTTSTPWPRYDLAISLNRTSGWEFMYYLDGMVSVVGATGPFGERGASSIATLAVEVVDGAHGNKFRG